MESEKAIDATCLVEAALQQLHLHFKSVRLFCFSLQLQFELRIFTGKIISPHIRLPPLIVWRFCSPEHSKIRSELTAVVSDSSPTCRAGSQKQFHSLRPLRIQAWDLRS